MASCRFFRRREPPDQSVMMYASKKGMSLRRRASKSPGNLTKTVFFLAFKTKYLKTTLSAAAPSFEDPPCHHRIDPELA